MSILRKLAGSLAALALIAGFAAPTASAQRDDRVRGERSLSHDRHEGRRDHGRRGGNDYRHHRKDSRRDRGYRGHDKRDRGGRYEYRRDRKYQGDRRHHARPYKNHKRYNYHDRRHRSHTVRPPVHHYGYKTRRAYNHHYNRPYDNYRHYKPRVKYHKPRYVARYRVGGRYGYGSHTVVIRDYRSHGLYHPPRGYHWVRDHDRGDAILCSVTSGAIIGLVIGALSY